MKNSKTVAIVGVGAVGQMLAYYLHSAGFEVLLYGRDGARALSQSVRVGGSERNLEIACQNREADIWLFATKAFDLASAVLKWMPKIGNDRPVVLLANGYIEPSLTDIRERFPKGMLRKAVVSRGAKFDAEGQLVLSERGEILWGFEGEPSLIEAEIMAALSGSGFRWEAKTCEARKIKWYCNTVLNSLAGAYRLSRNADALVQSDFDPLCHEVYLLGLGFWPDWAGQEESLKAKLKALIAMTSENENSMAVDVRLGRKTESEFLSGYVMMEENAQIRFPRLYALHQKLLNR